jgi:hypothetical protein
MVPISGKTDYDSYDKKDYHDFAKEKEYVIMSIYDSYDKKDCRDFD